MISENLKTKINKVSFVLKSHDLQSPKPLTLQIAIIGDIHLPESRSAYKKLEGILAEIKKYQPDLLLFVGDYTDHPRSVINMDIHRNNIVKILSKYEDAPSVFVLGNYESWSDPIKWIREFQINNSLVLENQVNIIHVRDTNICVRGLGDYYTNRFQYIDFPKECGNLAKITITHDPAGAFHPKFKGFLIAGHTHCGQVNFPFIGPLWIPSKVPKEAHCGLYKDDLRTMFTTSGIGTSIYPIRFRAQSNWDFLTVTFR